MYQARPSEIIGVTDLYEAYCIDEAIADFTVRIRRKEKLKPEKTNDNSELIAKLTGG